MISSMTAFARVEEESELGTLSWELRSVNHRYLDVSFRMPEELRVIEPTARERITKRLGRGKVEANLRFRSSNAGDNAINLDQDYAAKIVNALNEIQTLLPQPGELSVSAAEVLRWPGVIQPQELDLEKLQLLVLNLLDKALDELVEHRRREGEKLKAMILQRSEGMSELVNVAKQRLPEVMDQYRQRLLQRFEELKQTVDEQRLEQELVIVAQKIDVAEEMDRIDAHISELKHVLKKGGTAGRRLDFLMQEFNREANTLGSKSIDVETTRVSVDMKVLIEQMREQIQNIE